MLQGFINSSDWVVRRVEHVTFFGDVLDCRIRVADIQIQARVHPKVDVSAGDDVVLSFDRRRCVVLPAQP